MRKLLLFTILMALIVATAPVTSSAMTYIALRPDSMFCTFNIFGLDGDGDYTLIVDDPGYPSDPWTDIHLAAMDAGPDNIVIVPVCIKTDGREIGDDAVITIGLNAPDTNITGRFGVCVSDFEDIDESEETDVMEYSENPCDALNNLADLFSMGISEKFIHAAPGQKLRLKLYVYSDSYMDIKLSKIDGPKMEIEKTDLRMPENEEIDITIDAPQEPGEYLFTIRADVVGCTKPSCYREVAGIINVTGEAGIDYYAEMSPESADIHGAKPVTFYISIRNYGLRDTFGISLETDTGMSAECESSVVVDSGALKTIPVTAVPADDAGSLHYIKATVEDSNGLRYILQSTLTVNEILSDGGRMNENDSGSVDMTELEDEYIEDPVGAWERLHQTQPDVPVNVPDEDPGISVIIVMVVMAAAASVAIYYIYRKSVVSSEPDSGSFQPVYT